MEKIHLTLLDESQLWGDNRLEVIKRYGVQASITDFGVLTGGYRSSYLIHDGKAESSEINYAAAYWAKTINYAKHALVIHYSGGRSFYDYIYDRDIGVRPVLHLPTEKLVNLPQQVDYEQIPVFFFGEYPTYVADESIAQKLDESHSQQNLETTFKTYTIPYLKNKTKILKEYIYEGQKFVHIEPVLIADSWQQLSDSNYIAPRKPHWVKVEPIPWLYDEESDLLISKHSLIASIPFAKEEVTTFEETNMYNYLNNCLAKEILSSSKPPKISILDRDPELQKLMLKKR